MKPIIQSLPDSYPVTKATIPCGEERKARDKIENQINRRKK
jgi:hypothetical protein